MGRTWAATRNKPSRPGLTADRQGAAIERQVEQLEKTAMRWVSCPPPPSSPPQLPHHGWITNLSCTPTSQWGQQSQGCPPPDVPELLASITCQWQRRVSAALRWPHPHLPSPFSLWQGALPHGD